MAGTASSILTTYRISSGANGSSGTSGVNGSSGTSGTSGPQGPSGSIIIGYGSSGTSGTGGVFTGLTYSNGIINLDDNTLSGTISSINISSNGDYIYTLYLEYSSTNASPPDQCHLDVRYNTSPTQLSSLLIDVENSSFTRYDSRYISKVILGATAGSIINTSISHPAVAPGDGTMFIYDWTLLKV